MPSSPSTMCSRVSCQISYFEAQFTSSLSPPLTFESPTHLSPAAHCPQCTNCPHSPRTHTAPVDVRTDQAPTRTDDCTHTITVLDSARRPQSVVSQSLPHTPSRELMAHTLTLLKHETPHSPPKILVVVVVQSSSSRRRRHRVVPFLGPFIQRLK